MKRQTSVFRYNSSGLNGMPTCKTPWSPAAPCCGAVSSGQHQESWKVIQDVLGLPISVFLLSCLHSFANPSDHLPAVNTTELCRVAVTGGHQIWIFADKMVCVRFKTNMTTTSYSLQ